MNDSKGILPKISIGNIISIAIVVTGIVATFIRTGDHIKDENIHINDKTHKILTIEEYKNLLNFANTVKNKFPAIDKNSENINKLDKHFYGHQKEFEYLKEEHEGLESKVSRNYKELNDKISE